MGAATLRICKNCNVESHEISGLFNYLRSDCPKLLTTAASHMRDICIVKEHPHLSKYLGVSGQDHAFVGIVPGMPFNFTPSMPYDHIMHSAAEGTLKWECKHMLKTLFASKPSDEFYHYISLDGSAQEISFNTLISKDFNWPEVPSLTLQTLITP